MVVLVAVQAVMDRAAVVVVLEDLDKVFIMQVIILPNRECMTPLAVLDYMVLAQAGPLI
jgi:hypothetical protein